MTKRVARVRRAAGAAVVLFGVGAFVPFSLPGQISGGGASDSQAIEQVIAASLNAEQQLDVRPLGVPTGAQATTSAIQSFMNDVPAMTQSEVESWHADVSGTLSQYYTGGRLTRLNSVIWEHADEQIGAGVSDLELGGGVSDVQFVAVTINGSGATATVLATKWLRFAHRGDGQVDIITTPPSRARYTYALLRTANGWRISAVTGFTILTNAP